MKEYNIIKHLLWRKSLCVEEIKINHFEIVHNMYSFIYSHNNLFLTPLEHGSMNEQRVNVVIFEYF